MDRLKIECAGVAAGSKIFVGDCAEAVSARRDLPHTALQKAYLQPRLVVRQLAVYLLGKRDKTA
jgi:hypothetical protein